MPYVNGKWEPEDDTVAKQMTGLLAKDNAYMKQAETAGMQAAGRRGLANSSMAVGAVEGERIKAALPIATADASGLLQKNLSRQGFEQSDILQGKQIASTEKIASQDMASREGIASADRASRESMLGRELTSREGVATADRTATNANAAADRASRETLSREETAAANTRAEKAITADNQRAAAGAVSDVNTRRSTAINAVMNNPDLPPDVRQARIDDANAQAAADISLIEQIYNVDLDYAL